MPIVQRMAVAAIAAVALLPACQPRPPGPGTQSRPAGPPVHAEGCEPIAVDGESPATLRPTPQPEATAPDATPDDMVGVGLDEPLGPANPDLTRA
ncbi:MAG TPA: hypothetical protein VKD21_07045, partial [Acidimicrobiales bacterium]|nr:hypothetical protein [Acidimicrobiales bacterium]